MNAKRGRPRKPPKLFNWIKGGPAPVPDWLQEERKNDPVLAALESGRKTLLVQLGIAHRTIGRDEGGEYLTALVAPEVLSPKEATQVQKALDTKRREISEHSRKGGMTTRQGGLLEEVQAKAPEVLRRFLEGRMSALQAHNAMKRMMAPDHAPSARTLRAWRESWQ